MRAYTAWVIEFEDGAYYRIDKDGRQLDTKRFTEAVRFTRRVDARNIIVRESYDDARPVEKTFG